MIYNKLATSGEEIEQARFALGSLEDVVLLNLEHGKPAAFSRQRIAGASSRLLLHQQLVSSALPFLPRDNRRVADQRSVLKILFGRHGIVSRFSLFLFFRYLDAIRAVHPVVVATPAVASAMVARQNGH